MQNSEEKNKDENKDENIDKSIDENIDESIDESIDEIINNDIEIISYDEPEEEQPEGRLQQFAVWFRTFRKKKAVRIAWQFASTALMLAIAAGIGIFLAVGKVKGGPQIFADEYFQYYINGNYYSMYQATEIKESKFINMSTFSRFMSQLLAEGEVTDYDIEVRDKDSEWAHIKVNYKTKPLMSPGGQTTAEDDTAAAEQTTAEGDTAAAEQTTAEGDTTAAEQTTAEQRHTYSMTLKRQPENVLFFYSTWKGWIDDCIIKDCTIEVPGYVSPIFDNINIKDCLQGENPETGNMVYKLDRVFKGKHTIQLTGETIDTTNTEIVWEKSGDTYVLNGTDIPMKAEDKEAVEKKALELVVKYYQTALAGEGSDAVKALVPGADEAANTHIDEQLAAMNGEINHSDGRTLTNMEIVSNTCTIEDYKYQESLSVRVDYIANYTARKARSVIDGVRRQYVGTNTAAARVYFKCVDGVWTAANVDISCIDYTVEAK